MGFTWEVRDNGCPVPVVTCEVCERAATADALTVCHLDVQDLGEKVLHVEGIGQAELVQVADPDTVVVCGQECLDQLGGLPDRVVHPLRDYLAWLCVTLEINPLDVALQGVQATGIFHEQLPQ